MQTSKFIFIVLTFAAISYNSKVAAQTRSQSQGKYLVLEELDKRVKLEKIPATNVISLQFTGNYQKHPEAYEQIYKYAIKNYSTTGGIIGVYPKDPDLFDDAHLTWEINLRILPGKPGAVSFPAEESGNPFSIRIPEDQQNSSLSVFKKPAKPFKIKTLEATEAVTLISDVGHISADGLALNAWISLNNYVQTGTTRTEFGAAKGEHMQIPVKIIVPVKKRAKETR